MLDQTISPNKTTRTDYIGAAIYDNDALQLISHAEGCIRPLTAGGFTYDYFLKDHLGNVRIVLAENNPPQQLYLASMEPEKAEAENALFSNIDASRTDKPVGYPEDPHTDKNAFVAKLNGKDADRRIGPSLVLKVKSGDTVRLGTKAFYKSQGPNKAQKTSAPAADMAAALVRAFGNPGAAAAADHTASEGNNGTPFNNNFVNNSWDRFKERDPKSPANPDRPRAYLNFVLFDEYFNFIEGSSGVKQVGNLPDELQTLAAENIVMEKSGFLYVYTSNETQQDVYFDNVTVALAGTPVLEETHYYPFGLAMYGLSEKQAVGKENVFKYNGKELQTKEFTNGPGLEWYDFGARLYDPQIGRWHSIDPLADDFVSTSPYVFAMNNPIRFVDQDGRAAGDTVLSTRNNTTFTYRYNGGTSHTVIQTNTSSISASYKNKKGDLVVETTTSTNVTEYTFDTPNLQPIGNDQVLATFNPVITETNSLETVRSTIDLHSEGNVMPVNEVLYSSKGNRQVVNSVSDVTAPYVGNVTLGDMAYGMQNWMLNNSFRNLVQGEQPGWAKVGKSATGLLSTSVKYVIKDVMQKPWKGVKAATPLTIAASALDLIATFHKEYGNHAGKTVPLKPVSQ